MIYNVSRTGYGPNMSHPFLVQVFIIPIHVVCHGPMINL